MMTKKKEGSVYPHRKRAVHTLESIMARTERIGDCREWTSYATKRNQVPQVKDGDVMVSVRRLVLGFKGIVLKPTDFVGVKCTNPLCLNPDHLVPRSQSAHAKVMANALAKKAPALRAMKISAHARLNKAKITVDQAREIRMSEEPSSVLSERHGVSKEQVNRIRRGDAWRDYTSPFTGLGAR